MVRQPGLAFGRGGEIGHHRGEMQVGEAHAQRRRYSLWLPTQEIAPGSGADHYARCMSALALLP